MCSSKPPEDRRTVLTAVYSFVAVENGQLCKINQPIFKKTLPTLQILHRIC